MRCVSHAQDELHSFRSYLRWMCVDQSTIWTACLSWSMFVIFTIVVPAISHFVLACPTCDSKHDRPYDTVVQLSLSSVATLSFVCLSTFVRKYGLRRFLFFDKLWDDSETVRRGYTQQLNVSHLYYFFFLFFFLNPNLILLIYIYGYDLNVIYGCREMNFFFFFFGNILWCPFFFFCLLYRLNFVSRLYYCLWGH